MPPDYPAIASKVWNGLMKAGAAMTLTRSVPGVYDPALGEYSGSSIVNYSVVGVIQARSLYQTGAVGQNFNGVLVLSDDQFLLISTFGLGVTPIPGDILTITGISYTIMTAIPVRPGGIDLLYRVLARK